MLGGRERHHAVDAEGGRDCRGEKHLRSRWCQPPWPTRPAMKLDLQRDPGGMERSRVVLVRESVSRELAEDCPRGVVQLLESTLEERVVHSRRIDDEQVQVDKGTKLR